MLAGSASTPVAGAVVLNFYARLATRLQPFRFVFVLFAAAALAGFAGVLFLAPSSGDTGWMMLALLAFVWAVSALLIVHSFTHPLPVVAADAPWRPRLTAWLARAGRTLLALVMTVLCVMVLVLSFKGVGVITRTLTG